MFLWCSVSTCAHTSSIKYLPSLSISGSIVSVGDPKKKYTRFEKIGQGWVYICDHKSTLHSYWNRAISGAASLPLGGERDGGGGIEGMRLCWPLRWHGGSGTEGGSGWTSERKLRGEEMRSASWNGRRLIQLSSLLSSSLLLSPCIKRCCRSAC